MKRRILGTTGVPVAVIGQGTWEMEKNDRDTCILTLERGVDAGMTHIDTAELYGDGYVEEAIASEAIRGRRDEIFLTSKVVPQHASFEGTLAACDGSLERLRTDWIDLFLLHWRGSVPLAETFAAFERLVEAGKIRFFGVSNFDGNDVEEAVSVAGPERLAANQVLYHLQERAIEELVMPACERYGMAIIGYSPFGHGQFPSPSSREGRVLAEIAHTHGVTPRAVALAFLVRRPSTFTIPKATHPEHAIANGAAGDLHLRSDELARIDAAFPKGPPPLSLPML